MYLGFSSAVLLQESNFFFTLFFCFKQKKQIRLCLFQLYTGLGTKRTPGRLRTQILIQFPWKLKKSGEAVNGEKNNSLQHRQNFWELEFFQNCTCLELITSLLDHKQPTSFEPANWSLLIHVVYKQRSLCKCKFDQVTYRIKLLFPGPSVLPHLQRGRWEWQAF